MLAFIPISTKAARKFFAPKAFSVSVNTSIPPLGSHIEKIPLGGHYKVGTLKEFITIVAPAEQIRRMPFECDFSRTKAAGKSIAWKFVTDIVTSNYLVHHWQPRGFRYDLDGVLSDSQYNERGNFLRWDYVYINSNNELEIQWTSTDSVTTVNLKVSGGGFVFR